jgi:hypothetical protein
MQYKHNPPSLAELRQMRKQAEALLNQPKEEKKGLFSRNKIKEEVSDPEALANLNYELLSHEMDVIVAHLENQNELLLELVRKIDKNSN